jgi:ABC-type Fe3+ transport system permease subunit
LTFLGISTPVTTWHGAKTGIDTVNDITATVSAFWATYGITVFAAVCILAALVFGWLQHRQETDFEEGRYTPSGAE